jgi:crotonobetainyl-CoA:carnitine CoA-transferase CaiB-like acyl-CoA transferase
MSLSRTFAPGVMDRLGLGYEACQSRNPRLIYLSLPGFASTDAENADLAAWEGVVGAATGLFTNISFSREFLGLPPVFSALLLPSVYGAVHGAVAVAMALVARERDGCGDRIEVPLASAMFSAMGANIISYADAPERYGSPPVSRRYKEKVLPSLKRYFSALGKEGEREARALASNLLPPMMRSYQCADGRWLYVFAMDHRRMSLRLLRELGLWDRFRPMLVERDPYLPASVDNNISDVGTLHTDIKDQLRDAMAEVFKRKSAAVWEERLGEAGISCAMHRSTAEWLQTPHVADAGITVDVADPALGSMTQPGPAVWLDDSPPALLAPRPRVLTGDKGVTWIKRDNARPPSGERSGAGGCLAGVRVLDLTTMIAGPACGRTLAQYGAEVIKIDAVAPYLGPRMILFYAAEMNPDKRSVLLDLKKAAGREAFLRLVDGADVVLHNVRPGPMCDLGLDIETLRKRKPDIVVCAVSAFDGPRRGSWSSRAGYDPSVQAATGIATRYGGAQTPELHGVASTIDYLTGFLASFGTATALYKRAAHPGRGTTVRASLAQSAMVAQLPFSYLYEGRKWNEAAGQDSVGSSAFSRLHRALDGWVYVHIVPASLKTLGHLPRYSGITAATDVDAFLSSRFAEATVCEIIAELKLAGAGAKNVTSLAKVRMQYEIPRTESSVALAAARASFAIAKDINHPSGTTVHTAAPLHARLLKNPLRLGASSEKHGHSTVSILEAAGLSRRETELLLQENAISNRLSLPYLPS